MRSIFALAITLLGWMAFIQTKVPETPNLDIAQVWSVSWHISPVFTIAVVVLGIAFAYILALPQSPASIENRARFA